MVVFDKSNVHVVWDDFLVGRPCYFADSVDTLLRAITSQDSDSLGVVSGFGSLEKPFSINLHGDYSMVYPTDARSAWGYNKSYVHFDWDDSLEGCRGLMANSIGQIISLVGRHTSLQYIYKTGGNEYPFKGVDGRLYKFAYVDPYYDFRLALLIGEPIEVLYEDKWYPLTYCTFVKPLSYYRFQSESGALSETSPTGVHEETRPRVAFSDPTSSKKAKDVPAEEPEYSPVTVMELARWLSEGRGYCYDTETGKVITHFPFDFIAKDCSYNKSRYRLFPWGTEIPLSEVNPPYPKCGLSSIFF